MQTDDCGTTAAVLLGTAVRPAAVLLERIDREARCAETCKVQPAVIYIYSLIPGTW